uniref:Uncharacterized protein n=1 Tax=Serinus canaria TaxID=9135 RepID=A0A8C9NNF3_SERCA
ELGRGTVSGDPRGPAQLPILAPHTLPTQPRSQPRQTPSPTWKSSGCRRCPRAAEKEIQSSNLETGERTGKSDHQEGGSRADCE